MIRDSSHSWIASFVGSGVPSWNRLKLLADGFGLDERERESACPLCIIKTRIRVEMWSARDGDDCRKFGRQNHSRCQNPSWRMGGLRASSDYRVERCLSSWDHWDETRPRSGPMSSSGCLLCQGEQFNNTLGRIVWPKSVLMGPNIW